jgi:hypothetical protein
MPYSLTDLPDQLKKLAAKIDAKIKGDGSTRKGDETPDKGQDSTESKEVGTKENKENPAITSKGLPIDAKKQNDKKLGGELPADPTEMI